MIKIRRRREIKKKKKKYARQAEDRRSRLLPHPLLTQFVFIAQLAFTGKRLCFSLFNNILTIPKDLIAMKTSTNE